MKVLLARSVIGVFAFSDTGEVVDFEAFPADPSKVADRLKGGEVPEEEALLARLSGHDIEADPSAILPNLDAAMTAAGIEREAYRTLQRDVAFRVVKSGMQEAPRDLLIVQAIRTLDGVDEASNLLSERLREWYSLHYPELSARTGDHEAFARSIAEKGARDNFEGGADSMGMELEAQDIAILTSFAQRLKALYDLKSETEEYITSMLTEMAPTTAGLLGANLAARLIALAGGLEKLSMMPASRIQLLGAEKALFRHLKEKVPPPKHGMIFQHPLIKTSPWWQRGKIARALATKVAIASRVDAFSEKDISVDLTRDFKTRVEAIKKAYPEPPKKMRIIRTPKEKKKKKRRKRR
jgi:nucleolar protein 56